MPLNLPISYPFFYELVGFFPVTNDFFNLNPALVPGGFLSNIPSVARSAELYTLLDK